MVASNSHSTEGWLIRCLTHTALIAAWVFAWFFRLGVRPLGEPDEGRYAEVAREMYVSGDLVTPRLDGFHFFDKPVLQYWATTFFYALFGPHEWTSRLWPALTALLAIVVASWASGRLHGTRTAWTTALVLGSTFLFFSGARTTTLDMGIAAFLSIAICLFMVAQFDPRAYRYQTLLNLLGWASIALAVLSKGLIGVVFPALALCAFMIWERSFKILGRLSLAPGLILFFAIAAPWFVVVCLRHPDFFEYFFIREHFGRFLTASDNRDHQLWYFTVVVFAGLFPWVVFIPLTRSDWRSLLSAGKEERFLLCWIIVIFVFFSVSKSKLPYYILPIFPALAMLIGHRISTLSGRSLGWRLVAIGVTAIVCSIILFHYQASVRHLAQHLDLHPLLVRLGHAFLLIAIAALFATTAVIYQRRQAAIFILGFATLLSWQSVYTTTNVVAEQLSARPAAQLMLPFVKADTEVFTVHAYSRGLSFYLGRLVTVVDEDPADILPGVASRPEGYVPDIGEFERRWKASSSAVALVDNSLMQRFSTDALPVTVVGNAPDGVVIRRTTTP